MIVVCSCRGGGQGARAQMLGGGSWGGGLEKQPSEEEKGDGDSTMLRTETRPGGPGAGFRPYSLPLCFQDRCSLLLASVLSGITPRILFSQNRNTWSSILLTVRGASNTSSASDFFIAVIIGGGPGVAGNRVSS